MAGQEAEFVLGEVCFRTMDGFRYYHVSGPCDHSRIPETFGVLGQRINDSLTGAKAGLVGPEVARYLDAVPGTTWTLQVGHQLTNEAEESPGGAEIEELPPFRCAAMVYQGGVGHFAEAIGRLSEAVKLQCLELGREYREHYLYWEGPDSPNNVMLLQFGVADPPGGRMDLPETPAATFGPVRIQSMQGFDYLHVDAEADMQRLGGAINELMGKLVAAQRAGDVRAVGPVCFVYRDAGHPGLFTLEVGVPVAPGTPAPAGAKVRQVEAARVASLVYTGGLEHLAKANDALMEQVRELGLDIPGEYREWYHCFECSKSPNNVTQVMFVIR